MCRKSMIKGSDDTGYQRARLVRRRRGSQIEELRVRKSQRVAGSRRKMKFKGPSEESHQHLETFLDGDSALRVFVVWGEPAGWPSRSVVLWVRLPQGIEPVSQLFEVVPEKHNHTEATGSSSGCCLPPFVWTFNLS